jgi:cytochrome c
MSTLEARCALSLLLGLAPAAAFAETPGVGTPGLGKPVSEADIAAWDISVMPDGTGLPPGSGTAVQGARVYAEKCSACHGDGGRNPAAAGAGPMVGGPIAGIDGPKTIGSFHGYSTIVFDFVRRAMPYNMPRTLTNDEVYAVTAYLLSINKIVGENDVMNAETLPKVRMPNRDNFIIRFPDRI